MKDVRTRFEPPEEPSASGENRSGKQLRKICLRPAGSLIVGLLLVEALAFVAKTFEFYVDRPIAKCDRHFDRRGHPSQMLVDGLRCEPQARVVTLRDTGRPHRRGPPNAIPSELLHVAIFRLQLWEQRSGGR